MWSIIRISCDGIELSTIVGIIVMVIGIKVITTTTMIIVTDIYTPNSWYDDYYYHAYSIIAGISPMVGRVLQLLWTPYCQMITPTLLVASQ